MRKSPEIIQPGEDYSGAAEKALITCKEEQPLMVDLLYKLFRYEVEKCPTVEEVLAHK